VLPQNICSEIRPKTCPCRNGSSTKVHDVAIFRSKSYVSEHPMLTRQDKEKHCMQWRPGHGKHAVELEEQPSQLREGRQMTYDQLNHIPGTLPTALSPTADTQTPLHYGDIRYCRKDTAGVGGRTELQ
jgi:hypothetical protein